MENDNDNKPTVKLPVLLPTGKPHISYSELIDHIECSWRHKLKHIDKIVTPNDGPSIHTEYGQTIHDALENYVVLPPDQRKPIDPQPSIEDFTKRLEALKASGVEIDPKDEDEFLKSIPGLLKAVPEWLDKTFPGWEGISSEKKLYETIVEQKSHQVLFKGFIDAIIRVPKYKKVKKNTAVVKKNSLRLSDLVTEHQDTDHVELIPIEGKYEYYVLDWKTTGHGWSPDKKRDFNKQLQIILYKHFFCEIMNHDLKEVKCGFVLLKRKPSKKYGHCELVPVSVGPTTQTKALNTLNASINQIKKLMFMKNRRSCKYCGYFNTEHCR